MIEDLDIVFLSNIPWIFSWQRHQQLATRFAGKNRILFVEPPISFFLFLHNRELFFQAVKKTPAGIRNLGENLFLFTPSPVLPGGRYFLPVQRLNQNLLAGSVRRAMARLRFSSPIIWNFMPYFPDTSFSLDQSLTLYDCVDELRGEDGGRKDTVVRVLEGEAVRKSDLVLTTSRYLYRTRAPDNPKTYLLPNGADFDRFQAAGREREKIIPEIDCLPFPRIGYAGTFNLRIDMELIGFLARQKPAWSFVCIGTVTNDPGGLNQLSNIHFLGHKPISELPYYLQKMSLGILPYRITKATRAIHPVKVYDYLSSGLPVVSTPLPECDYFANYIEVAHTPEEFLNRVDRSLKNDTPALRMQRLKFAENNSWDERVEEASRILEGFLSPGND